jgi:ribosomal protein S18 acetylase RimI-like enzyme
MADNIRATPRNELLGLLSDAYKWMQSPESTQQMQGFAGLLGTTGLPQTIERLAYGEDLTNINRANMPLLKPETADALLTVAPFAPKGMKMIRATEGLPVGMSIKDVGKKSINVRLNEASNFLSAKSEFGEVGGTIRPPDKFSDVPYLQINYAEVEKASRGKGRGKELYQSLIDEAQARGLRVFSDSTVEKPAVNVYKSLEKSGYQLKDMTTGRLDDGAVYGSGATNPAFEISSAKSFQAPQQAALDLAQARAALPIEQGGLGLPANNTAADRAKAMGFKTPALHGSGTPDINAFDPNLVGTKAGNAFDNYMWFTSNPESASGYSLNTNQFASLPEIKDLNSKINQIGKDISSAYNEKNMDKVGDLRKELNSVMKQKSDIYKDFEMGKYVSEGSTIYPVLLKTDQFMPYEAGGQNWMKVNRPAIEESQSRGLQGVEIRNVKDNPNPSVGNLIANTYATENPDLIRSRFAAFDPFRKDAATATAMGVALPDLLAGELPEEKLKRNQSAGLLFP